MTTLRQLVTASEQRRRAHERWLFVGVAVMYVGLTGACVVAGKGDMVTMLVSALVAGAGGYCLGRWTREKGRG